MDLVLNNLQRLICHKTLQTKPNSAVVLENKKLLKLVLTNHKLKLCEIAEDLDIGSQCVHHFS